jgi:hypothetical protein
MKRTLSKQKRNRRALRKNSPAETRENKATKALETILAMSEIYYNDSKFILISKIAREGLE